MASFLLKQYFPAFSLLRQRRFAPLFLIQYLSAFNDNLYKNALVVLIAYGFLEAGAFTPILTTLSWGIFILPFFLFSFLAGEVATIFEKAFLIRCIKGAEILILGLAVIGLFTKSILLLYFGLFLMGAHATFFLPTKYGLLLHHLKPTEFLKGTGFMESITFLGVFLGNLLGGFLILEDPSAFLFLSVAFCAAFIGFGASFFIPSSPSRIVISKKPLHNAISHFRKPLFHISSSVAQKKLLFVILGISWFWSYEGTLLSQIPTLIKSMLFLEPKAVSFFLFLFSLGTMMGALLCNKLLKGIPSARLVPLTLFLLSICLIDFVANLYSWQNQELQHSELLFTSFLKNPIGIRILIDFIGIALCGGVSVIPLYAILQSRTSPTNCAHVFALNNVMNAIFMVGWSLFIVLLFFLQVDLLDIFCLIAGMNGALSIFTWILLKTAYGQKLLEIFLNKLLKPSSYALANP